MSPIALVIFRESLEIALILGIVLAATRDLPGRNKWILLGALAGISGAGLVALFTDKISEMAEGSGQEIMNASILLVAAFFIGWTVIWMKKHAREMAQKLKKVGNAVKDGNLPHYSLSVIIALALLREGSEIVLFTYSQIISKIDVSALLAGCTIGAAAGFGLGTMIYLGLIRMSTKHLFTVTSWMLMLLVAGLASEAAKFLSSAGYFSSLSGTLWDTSKILSEESALGQLLKVLIGYSSRPIAIQLVFYLLTLGVLIMTIKIIDRLQNARSTKLAVFSFIIMATAILANPQAANATKKVYWPYVEKGELELEWKGQYDIDHKASKDGKQKQRFSAGYGLTDKWFSELFVQLEQAPDKDYKATEAAWENIFQLTDKGEYFVDVGAYVELETSFEDDSSDKIEAKLLLAKDTGPVSHAANLVLNQEVGGNHSGGIEPEFAWSSKYRLSPYFEPGFEVHSEFGKVHENKGFEEQNHLAGPAIYGELPYGFKYDVGYLFGLSQNTPDATFKWIIEYEVHF